MGYEVKKCPTAPLERTMKELRMKAEDIASETGINPTTLRKWLREGQMPSYMALVCEGLTARHAGSSNHDETLVVRVPRSETEVLERFLEAIRGQSTKV